MIKRFLIIIIPFAIACKKDDCWNTYGENSEFYFNYENSFDTIKIGSNLVLDFYQDTGNYMIIRTGDKVMENVEIRANDSYLEINNNNTCNFLINHEKQTNIEFHFDDYHYLSLNTEEKIIFHDTIETSLLYVYYGLGGGELDLTVKVNHLTLAAYAGSGNFNLNGTALSSADLRVQDQTWGDAQHFWSPNYKLYNNSIGDLQVNLDESITTINQKGTGNIIYTGTPDSLIILPNNCDGKVIPE